MENRSAREMIEEINDPETTSKDVLRIADELFSSSKMIYVGRHNPASDEMLQNILHALVKQVRK